MNHQEDFSGEVFDVASGISCSLNQIKEVINSTNKVEWVTYPERKGDIKHSHSKISGLLSIGWKPSISIEDGLRRCFKRRNK